MPALPAFDELREGARVVALPLVTRFRGIDVREVLLMRGPQGWAEFAPFVEYDDEEASHWLAAAVDFGWNDAPASHRDRIRVNATLPAVALDKVAETLDRFGGARTVKVKVAAAGESLADDVARVRATRDYLGAEGRIRVDANGAWNVDEAERAAHALAPFDLEYLEQPCATVDELIELRERLHDWQLPIAADESIRHALDPLAVVEAGAADVVVIKAAPLGGVHAALRIAAAAGVPIVVSSALDSSVGIGMGLQLAAALPDLELDCGLGTAALLAADVTSDPLLPRDGWLEVRRAEVDPALLDRNGADAERTAWWLARLERCYEALAAS